MHQGGRSIQTGGVFTHIQSGPEKERRVKLKFSHKPTPEKFKTTSEQLPGITSVKRRNFHRGSRTETCELFHHKQMLIHDVKINSVKEQLKPEACATVGFEVGEETCRINLSIQGYRGGAIYFLGAFMVSYAADLTYFEARTMDVKAPANNQ